MRIIKKIDKTIGLLLRLISRICLGVLLLLLAGNVFVRFVPIVSFGWFDEIVEWAFAWLVFLGATALWRENEHFRIEWIQKKLSGKVSGYLTGFIFDLISLIFFIALAYEGIKLMIIATDTTPIFKISKRVLYLCLPVSGGLMSIYSLRNCVKDIYGLIRLYR